MRWISYRTVEGAEAVGIAADGGYRGLPAAELGADLLTLLTSGRHAQEQAAAKLAAQPAMPADEVRFLPVLPRPPKIICIGLNYRDHSKEAGFEAPAYPAIFARYATSLVGHRAPIVRPAVSAQLDYEGELAVVIGRGGRGIAETEALDHVAGYAIFNDGSIRDYQTRSAQWTIGKTFDRTGGFGPELVSADELPLGCRGLSLETRLNGQIVQRASIDDMIFDVPRLISLLSEAMTLEPGDVIVTGTPAGIGAARKPPLWMKPGDICEVSIQQIGTLANPIADEIPAAGSFERKSA